MAKAARLNDPVAGVTAGEHNGHSPPHGSLEFVGEISGGCAEGVYINGEPAAIVGSQTTERDGCCGSSNGVIAASSATVFITGRSAARLGDALRPHSGSGIITGGSADVNIG